MPLCVYGSIKPMTAVTETHPIKREACRGNSGTMSQYNPYRVPSSPSPLSGRLWQSTSPRDGLRGFVRQSQSIDHVPCGGQDLESPSRLVAPLSVRPWYAILSQIGRASCRERV